MRTGKQWFRYCLYFGFWAIYALPLRNGIFQWKFLRRFGLVSLVECLKNIKNIKNTFEKVTYNSLLQLLVKSLKWNVPGYSQDNHRLIVYYQPIFQVTMLSSFLQVLLTALIAKSHNLLQEEIIAAIYNMVSSNFDVFFTQFIPHYLMNVDGLRDHQRSQLHQNFKRHQVILKDKFIWEDPSSRNLFPLISVSLFRKYKLLKVLGSFYFWCSIKFSKKSVHLLG